MSVAAKWALYTYPGCSSCRDAEKWLSQRNVDFTKIHIYHEPPDRQTLLQIAAGVDGGLSSLIATRGRAYRNLGLQGKEFSDEEWLDLIEKEPWLLRRPIVTDGKTSLVGFKKEEWEAVFES